MVPSLLGLLFDLFVLVASVVVSIYSYYQWSFRHWERLGVVSPKPKFPFGTFDNPATRTESRGQLVKRLYRWGKSLGEKHIGLYLFTNPIYVPIDVDIIKAILSKDFQYFMSRGLYVNEKIDPLSGHLFNISGHKWRQLRIRMTPTFTAGKMKMMFSTLIECSDSLIKTAEGSINKPLDIKEVLACFTTDVIGSVAFGLECNSFKEDNAPFRKYGRKIFEQFNLNLKTTFLYMLPNVAKMLNMKQTQDDVEEFFIKAVRDTVYYRETSNFKRNDFMQLMVNLRKTEEGKSMTIEELAAQCFVFFIAGFETSSTTMTFALYELAKNRDIQSKVREEIRTVLKCGGGQLTYEAAADMKYLGQVIDEALRMYPPLPMLHRVCTENYTLSEAGITFYKGQHIHIPVYGLHYDPDYFPDPERFNPDRFSEENKANIKPFTYMPFGEGPRLCVGMRFGLVESKVGLIALLKDHEFSVNQNTPEPLKMHPLSFITSASDTIWLDVKRIE